MNKKANKTYILVIGMHRSGTSLIANLLTKASVFMGDSDNFLPPNFDNRFGFYENKNFLKINEGILSKFDVKWNTTKELRFDQQVDLSKEKDIAKKFIENISAEHNILAFKDPRATITLPFWKDILGKNLKIIFVKRNPLEIAESLEKRNSFSKKKSLDLWESYILNGLQNIKEEDVLFVEYADILENPFPNFVRMLKYLNIDYSKEILKEMYFAIAPEIRHSVYTEEDFLNDESIDSKKKELFKRLEKQYEQQLEKYPLEDIDVEISLEERNKHLEEKNRDLGEELDNSRSERSVLKTEIAKIEGDEDLKEELLSLHQTIEKLQKEERRLTLSLAREGKANEALAKENEEFRAFKQSSLWKLLKRYRKTRNKFVNLIKKKKT
jgi:hypothetical protein